MLNIQYIAGFVDGEGCISLTGRYNNRRERLYTTPIIQVTNLNREILELLKQQFGGSVRSRKHPQPNRRLIWCWAICANKAINFLRTVEPFLIIKKPQAKIVLGLIRCRKNNIKYGNLTKEISDDNQRRVNEIRILNKRGI